MLFGCKIKAGFKCFSECFSGPAVDSTGTFKGTLCQIQIRLAWSELYSADPVPGVFSV
ncbi:hypothetical protein MNBD_GAMMA09-555 [hydrothermal vent metagenome]|uniref:Uncharacterized protein n=1 Tax=hydrothermal vent metagenome TaxID=652676 RepID=A0A3B0X3V9_9ZZZZ